MGFNTKKHQITDKDMTDIKSNLDGYFASEAATNKRFEQTAADIKALQSVQNTFYGVRFTGSNPTGERLGAAVGLHTAVGIDDEIVDNDFDKIYPWSEYKECNGYYDDDGEFVVTAYKGDPTFARDGSNGEVYVEFPQFFIRDEETPEIPAENEGEAPIEATESYLLSPVELYGYRLPEKFIKLDGTRRTKIYIPVYEAGAETITDGDGNETVVPVSRSGYDVSAPGWTYLTMLDACHAKGEGYSGMTMEDYEVLKFLVLIEFGTRDTQSVQRGAVDLSTSAYRITEDITDSTDITVPASVTQFFEGAPVKLSTSSGNKAGEYHTIEAVTPQCVLAFPDTAETPVYDEYETYYVRSGDEGNYTYTEYVYNSETWATDFSTLYVAEGHTLTLDSPVTVAADTYMYCCPYKTGVTDNVVASVGAYKANNGKYPIKYRGIENLWGNTLTTMHGIVIKSRQSYVTKDAANSPTTVNDTVTALSYRNCTSNGYISKFGHDPNYPAHTLPIEADGSDSTYYCDRYTQLSSASSVCAVRFGGSITRTSSAGLFCFSCNNTLSISSANFSSRLSYTG